MIRNELRTNTGDGQVCLPHAINHESNSFDKGPFMKRLILGAILGLVILPQAAFGQAGQTLLDFKATGYEYTAVKSDHSSCLSFWKLNSARTGWSTGYLGKTGNAAFGTINNTSSPPCPLNTPDVVKVSWPSSRDLLVRKKVVIPAGARDVVIQLALDNKARVYFNGVLLSGPTPVLNNGCATLDNPSFRFSVPDGLLKSGNNFLAIHGIWVNAKSFLDVKVTGKLSYPVTTTVIGQGTVTPTSPTEVLAGAAYNATYAAATGFRIASITRNGSPVVLDTTRLTPESYALSIPSVTAAQQIVVTFIPKWFIVTGVAGTNGTVSPQTESVLYGGGASCITAQASTGYHIEEVTSDPPLTTLFSASQPTTAPSAWPGPGGPYVFTNVANDLTLTASFGINYYSLSYAAGQNGNVQLIGASTSPLPGTSYYQHATLVTLKAVAASGHYFSGWTGIGAADQMTNPLSVTMNGDKNITASFELLPDPVEITVGNLNNGGSGSLRQAILDANAAPGVANIVFTSGLGGTITLTSPLPALADVVSITGGTNADGQPLITVLRPSSGFTANPALPDGLQLSGVFLGFGYTPEGSTIRNLKITGFPGAGICIGSDNNIVQGCVITGNTGDGVCIIDGSDNLIGGKLPGQANSIYRNLGNGVVIKKSEPATGFPSGNGVLGNSLYENGKLGIDLGGTGVTTNRYPTLPPAGSTRPAPARVNFGQAYPDLRYASVAGLNPVAEPSVIIGKLWGWPGGKFRVEIYMDSLGNPSGNGEGKRLIAVKDFNDPDPVMTDASGIADFEIVSTVPLIGGEVISATATDDANNTSEFSPSVLAGTITRIYGATDLEAADAARFVVNTTFSGSALYWPDGKAKYTVSSSVPVDLRGALDAAFDAWEGITGLPNGVTLQFNSGEQASDPQRWGGAPDGVNNLVFLCSDWETVTGSSVFATAVTRVRYSALTGAITDADIAFNCQNFLFRNYPLPAGEVLAENMFDTQSIATHEIGHLLGLGDQYNWGDPYASLFHGSVPCAGDVTMYGIVRNTDTFQRHIGGDDVKGLAFIYNFVPRGAIDLMFVFDGSQSFANSTPINGYDPSVGAAIELIDKMRDGDRVAAYKLTQATPYIPFTTIDALSRESIKQNLALLQPDLTDTRPIGTGLTNAAGSFTGTDIARRAIILFSAGNETESPSALSQSVLNALRGKGIRTFTLGFPQSPQGANLSSILADTTSGAFYDAADTSISNIVNQIWINLAGYQLVGDSTLPSDAISYQGNKNTAISYQGVKNNAISWQSATKNTAISYQGRTDAATTSVLPAISYQGKGAALAKAVASTDPRFVLALVPPDVDPDTVNWAFWESLGQDPPYVITPFNVHTYAPHVTYYEGAGYAFYVVGDSYPRKKDGIWRLVPVGDNPAELQTSVPVRVFLVAATDVVMDVTFDRSNYTIGQTVAAQILLEEGGLVQGQHTVGGSRINGASVVADVSIPGQAQPVTIPLAFSGNGVYTLKFTGSQAGGTYAFTFRAVGVTSQGQPFSRTLEQSAYVLPAYSNAVLFAAEKITLSDKAWVKSGDMLVNRDAPASDPSVEFFAGTGVRTPAGFDIKADRVQIGAGSIIGSDVYYNQLVNAGTITGALNTPLSLPVDVFPPFEDTSPSVANASFVWVPMFANGGSLAPGSYGSVTLRYKSRLTLAGGDYHFRSLRLDDGAKLYFAGPARVHVRYGVDIDDATFIGPATGGTATASDLVVFVKGTDPECGHSYVVNVDEKASISGSFYAPNGTIKLNQEAKATGALLAKSIRLGKLVQVTLASAYSPLARLSVEGTGDASSESSPAEEIPDSYELGQNYPNPFNPSTTITYALPQQGHVSLIVYDALGREVTRLVDNVQPEGYHTVQWAGVNSAGSQVSTGVYFYRLQAGDFSQIQKMVLVK